MAFAIVFYVCVWPFSLRYLFVHFVCLFLSVCVWAGRDRGAFLNIFGRVVLFVFVFVLVKLFHYVYLLSGFCFVLFSFF